MTTVDTVPAIPALTTVGTRQGPGPSSTAESR